MPENKEVEIEVALKDSTSAVLKQIAQEIDNVSRKLVETGRRGSDAFERMKRGADQSGGGTKSTNASLADMNTIMGNLAKSMLGPVGIAAGFTALTRAMGNFAQQRVQVQALSTDLGFSVNSISIMDRTFRRMGLTFEAGRQQMGVWGDKLRELATYKTSSQFYRDLVAMGEKDFADKLMKAAGKNIDQARDMMLSKGEQTYREDGAARGRHYSRVIGTNESMVKSYRQTSEGVKASHQARYFESVEYLKKEEEVTNAFNKLWIGTAEVTIKALNEIDGGMWGMNAKLQAFGDLPFFKTLSKWLGTDKVEWPHGKPAAPSPESTLTGPPPQAGFVQEQFGKISPVPGRAAGGPVYSGRAYMVGERGPELFSPGQSGTILASLGAGQTMKELSDTEKDSNQSLRDIRDILQKMEEEREGETGASGSSGGGTQTDGTGTGTGTGGGKLPKGQAAENAQRMYDEARKLGYSHEEASAILGHVQAESGFNPNVVGDRNLGPGREARGFLQHREGRWKNYQTKAKEWGMDPNSPEFAMRFFDWEVKNDPKNVPPGLYQRFKDAKTIDEKTRVLNEYWRFKNWKQGQPGRYNAARAFGDTMVETGPGGRRPGPMGQRVEEGIGGAFGGDVREKQGRARTRRGALDPRLKSALDYASAQTGLTVDVTSGGQRMPGARGWVGSHRHDQGRAADFNLRDEKGRIVHPDDPRAIAFYEHAARGGVTGGSHSYMDDPTKIHLDISGGAYRKGRTTRAQFAAFNAALERGKAARRAQGPPIPPDQARKTVDGASAGGGSASGKVTATVDFGNMPKPGDERRPVFFRAAIPSSRTHRSVREGEVLPGDDGYGQWVP